MTSSTIALSPDETREAVLLAANLERNPTAIAPTVRELVKLRGLVRALKRVHYVRNAPPVKRLLDELPRGWP